MQMAAAAVGVQPELYWIRPVWHPQGAQQNCKSWQFFLYISKYTCCTVFATSRESIYKPNCGWRYSTNFRTPWYHRRPPPQMFKVYIVSRWIWADLRAIRLRAVIVSVDAGASLGGLPATHWMSGLRNVVMALRSRSPDFPRHCPPRKLSLWFSSLLPKFWLRGLACACARGTSTRRRRFWDQCGTIFHARVELLQWERGRKESASPFFYKGSPQFFWSPGPLCLSHCSPAWPARGCPRCCPGLTWSCSPCCSPAPACSPCCSRAHWTAPPPQGCAPPAKNI